MAFCDAFTVTFAACCCTTQRELGRKDNPVPRGGSERRRFTALRAKELTLPRRERVSKSAPASACVRAVAVSGRDSQELAPSRFQGRNLVFAPSADGRKIQLLWADLEAQQIALESDSCSVLLPLRSRGVRGDPSC